MMSEEIKAVRIKGCWGKYADGDVAGFPVAEAERLIAGKFAVDVSNAAPVALTQGDDEKKAGKDKDSKPPAKD